MERNAIPPAAKMAAHLIGHVWCGQRDEAREIGSHMPLHGDRALKDLLDGTRTIAVLGIKAGEHEDAFRVPRYMQRHGFAIRPVSPKLAEVLGERAVASVCDLEAPVDMIDVFRAPANIPGHVDEILAMKQRPKSVWLQLGIAHPATARLEAAGILVVEDRCLMVEHARLFRGAPDHG